MSTSDWIEICERVPTLPILILASNLRQQLEHVLHRGQDAGIGGIGVLQVQEVCHLLIHIHGGAVVEALLQRVEDDGLSVGQVAGGRCSVALSTDDLTEEAADGAAKWRR